MFDSSSSEKSSGLFSGVPTISSGNLFPISSTRDNKPSDTGLFGMLASTTESKTECGMPTFGFTSNHKSEENVVKSGNLFDLSPSNSNPIQSQYSTPLTVNINTSAGARRDLDSPEDLYNYAKCSDSNDMQSVDQTHWPAVKLSRLPIGNNTKAYLQNQFQRFGRIERIICQPSLDSAYVAFDSMSSASRAKRLGREPVSPDDGGLPSTVLLTMSRCRRFSNSGSRLSPKFSSTSGFSMNSSNKLQLSSVRTSGLKRPILSRTHTKPIVNKKQFSSVTDSSGDNQSPVTSNSEVTKTLSSLLPFPQPPAPASTSASLLPLPSLSQTVYSTQSIISPISLSNAPIHNGNNLFQQKSVYAVTLEERLSLLQEYYKRDCELRTKSTDSINLYSFAHHSNSNTDEPIHHAPIKGTCEDMCPELERYLRAVHQRVSIFECLPSTLSSNSSSWEMDHTRAVKDYQRSSADQPVPLPRELRPTHVLQRTMAYLLATIADRPEIDTTRSLWKPWYEFMWTRTRAIRKDIRQQNLCCPIVISVIERIARFHIFCAARLVDQPVDSFDPRINSENLTQCLQTLKEMYSDLDMLNSSSTSLLSSSSSSTSAEHLCPNEAEFRAYMLLMKLNDQNEINEAQRLPDRIRKSKPVRFAFAAHEALITNNYVRFFRLARLAQCLPACLMHRYFVQIRGQALTRLSYAFAGHPKREVHYPISTLTRQLGFENNTETKDFCERWGLTTDDSNVIFEKQVQPEPPELPWRENRSFQLIENKRIGTTLSELFNGSPINPSDAIPPPVKSSFDTNGMYIAGGQNTNVQTVTSNNDNNNNNMVVSSSGGFGNALFSNRITADDGSSSNNRNSNIINSTVDYSLSSSSLFPSFQQAKLNSSLITSQSSSSSSWLTGAANTQNKKPIDNQLVEQIFYECVVDDVMHFKELAESLLLQEMIIHEWIENLIETLFKEQLIEIYNKVIHPVNEMSKVMIESLINEIINEELYHIVQSEFILESLCNEIFDQLIKERLYKLTSSSLTKSLATSLYNANLIKYCVNHFRYLIWKREEAEQDEILLNRMSTSVGVDCLPLRLMLINNYHDYYCNTTKVNVSANQSQANNNLSDAIDSQKTGILPVRNALLDNHYLMNSRFSPEISKVDDGLTWSVLKPSSIFCKYPLGIYTSILLPPYGCSETVQKQLKNTVHWIYRKFKDFPLILLDKWPDSSLSGKLSALIVIGQFNHPITREQLVLSMQPLDSSDVSLSNSSSQRKPVDDHLLVLAITIATQTPLSLSTENLKNPLNDNDGICVLQLTNHISLGSGGKFLPNPYWSINLQYSLNWLEECFRRMLNRSPVDVRSWNHRRKCQINNASNNNRNHHIYSTTSLSSLSASTSASTVPAEVTVYTELSDLVDQYIDACFLRPLADLSAFWKSQDFVDPSMKSLLDAYHTMLSRLFVQLLPVNKELTNRLHNTLILSKKVINLVCIDYLEETKTESKTPSNLALKSPSSPSSSSSSSSSSWSILVQNWTTLSKELNFSLSTECWINTSIRKVEQNFKLHLNKVFSPSPVYKSSSTSSSIISNSIRKVLPSVYLAPNLNLFFALIRNGLNNLSNVLVNNYKAKSNIELAKVIEFSNVIVKLIEQIEPESILNDMTEYFKNIDEPCMKQVNAINLSIHNSRYNDIKKCLLITKPSSSSSLTSMSASASISASNVEQEESSLSVRLDKLCLKIQQVENSMTEALNETTQSTSSIQ